MLAVPALTEPRFSARALTRLAENDSTQDLGFEQIAPVGASGLFEGVALAAGDEAVGG